MICRRHLTVARARQNFVCARSCGFGMEGCSRYAHGFATPSATVAVTDDGDVTSSPPTAVLAQEVVCVSQAASIEFSPHKCWRKSVGCQMQVPSWPRWRAKTPLFSVPNHEGSHMYDVSDPHGSREQRRRTDGVMRERDTARVVLSSN